MLLLVFWTEKTFNNKAKTYLAFILKDIVQEAAKTVEKVISAREPARQYGVDRHTSKRFIDWKVPGALQNNITITGVTALKRLAGRPTLNFKSGDKCSFSKSASTMILPFLGINGTTKRQKICVHHKLPELDKVHWMEVVFVNLCYRKNFLWHILVAVQLTPHPGSTYPTPGVSWTKKTYFLYFNFRQNWTKQIQDFVCKCA